MQRAKPRAFRLMTRGVEGVETRMIGREAELKRLQAAFYAAAGESEPQVVTVVGEAGIGKSRLLYEFSNWLELLPERVRFFKGRADPSMQHIAYSLLRDVFALRFGIQDSDAAEVVRQKIERRIAETFAASPTDRVALEQDEAERGALYWPARGL